MYPRRPRRPDPSSPRSERNFIDAQIPKCGQKRDAARGQRPCLLGPPPSGLGEQVHVASLPAMGPSISIRTRRSSLVRPSPGLRAGRMALHNRYSQTRSWAISGFESHGRTATGNSSSLAPAWTSALGKSTRRFHGTRPDSEWLPSAYLTSPERDRRYGHLH